MSSELPAHIELGFEIEPKGTTPPLTKQVHGNVLANIESIQTFESNRLWPPEADGIYTSSFGIPIYVYSADCIPVLLFTEEANGPIAAIHSGWRGSLRNIVKKAVEKLLPLSEELHAIIGPCLRACHFEVKEDFIQAFKEAGQNIEPYLEQRDGKIFCHHDRFMIEDQLSALPPDHVHTSVVQCTYCSEPKLPSYRRNGNTDIQLRSWIRKVDLFHV